MLQEGRRRGSPWSCCCLSLRPGSALDQLPDLPASSASLPLGPRPAVRPDPCPPRLQPPRKSLNKCHLFLLALHLSAYLISSHLSLGARILV